MPSWPATSMPYRCAGPAAPPFRSITTAAVILDAEDVVLAEMSGAARQTNPGRWLASPSPKNLSCKACLAAQLADAAHLIDSFFADFGHHFPILTMLTFEGGIVSAFRLRATITLAALLSAAALVVIVAPWIGLGQKEDFLLYKLLGMSRSASLNFILVGTTLLLIYPLASLIAPERSNERNMGHLQYRPDVDGLRAIAVISVILNHFDQAIVPNGYLGVDIFFVISGYVIIGAIATHTHSSFRDFLLEFYERRARRILPALIVFALAASLAISLVSPTPEPSLEAGIYSLFGVSNIYFFLQATNYFAEASRYNAFNHTWSLGVEEQFYLFVPAIAFVCLKAESKTRVPVLALTVTALGTASFVLYLSTKDADPAFAFYMLPSRAWEIGAGGLVFLLFSRQRRQGFLIPLLAVIGMGASLSYPAHSSIFNILGVVSAAALIATNDSPIHRIMGAEPFAWVGRISYSFYLWHWGVLAIGSWLLPIGPLETIAMLLSTATLSISSYYLVERPLRRFSYTSAPWKAAVAGLYGCIAAFVLIWCLEVPASDFMASAAAAINPLKIKPEKFIQTQLRCHLPPVQDPIGACLAGAARSKPTIYVIGDSHASNHVPSLMAASHAGGFQVKYLIEWGFILTVSGVEDCSKHSSRPCLDESFKKHLAFFRKNLKRSDIVVFSWARDRIVDEGPLPRQPRNDIIATLEEHLVVLKKTIASAGASLVLVDDLPKPCTNSIDWNIIYAGGRYELCSSEQSLSRLDRRPLTRLYKSLLGQHTFYVDFHDVFCNDGMCGIFDERNHRLIFADNSPHFTVSNPALLIPRWKEALRVLLHMKAKHLALQQ